MRTSGEETNDHASEDVGRARAGESTKAAVTSAVAKSAAVATAGLMLTATAGLAAPGTAAAETKKVRCGSTVTAEPGDRIQGITALGIPLDLGLVTDTIGSLLSGVCKVTVNVVDTAVRPVPGAGDPAADAVNGTVGGLTRSAKKATDTLGGREVGVPDPGGDEEPPDPAPGDGGDSGSKPGDDSGSAPGSGSGDGSGQGSGDDGAGVREPNSPVVDEPERGSRPGDQGGGASALAAPAAMSPELRYAGIPVASGAMFDAAPGLRYGGQIPGYKPDFGRLGNPGGSGSPSHGADGNVLNPESGSDGQATGPARENSDLRTAGEASSLPSAAAPEQERGPSMPLLLAVLALAGVSAGLVRTWAIQRASLS